MRSGDGRRARGHARRRRLRRCLDGRDSARRVPPACGRGRLDRAGDARNGDRDRVHPQPDGDGHVRLGPAAGEPRPLRPRPRHAGASAQRAALLGALGGAGAAAAGAGRGAPAHLGRVPGRASAPLPRAVLPPRPDHSVLRPWPDRLAGAADLPGRGHADDVQARRGGRGRRARARLPHRALPAGGGAPRARPEARRDDARERDLRRDRGRRRRGADADRVLRVDADVPARLRGARLGRPAGEAPRADGAAATSPG